MTMEGIRYDHKATWDHLNNKSDYEAQIDRKIANIQERLKKIEQKIKTIEEWIVNAEGEKENVG